MTGAIGDIGMSVAVVNAMGECIKNPRSWMTRLVLGSATSKLASYRH